MNSLHLRERTIRKIKAAIQGGGCTDPHVAPAIKASNAQKADFAVFCKLMRLAALSGPERTSSRWPNAAVQPVRAAILALLGQFLSDAH